MYQYLLIYYSIYTTLIKDINDKETGLGGIRELCAIFAVFP